MGATGSGRKTIFRLFLEGGSKDMITGTGITIMPIIVDGIECQLVGYTSQARFYFGWPVLLKNSRAILLVVDSSDRNDCEWSRRFVSMIYEHAPNVPWSIIANKQDLKEALSPARIAGIFDGKAPVVPLIATDRSSRATLLQVLHDLLSPNKP